MLCFTDYFTQWVIAIAAPDCSAQTTTEALFKELICKYGVPTVRLSDQGTHFHNQLMKAMSRLIGYEHAYSTTYQPQSNGMIERFNATFIPQIAINLKIKKSMKLIHGFAREKLFVNSINIKLNMINGVLILIMQ